MLTRTPRPSALLMAPLLALVSLVTGVLGAPPEFAEVDGDLTPAEEAERNNQRAETAAWAAKLRAMVAEEPEWSHYDELYRTGITGNLRTG